jgi:hypothetical protein
MPFKDFVDDEVLWAADFDRYWVQQTSVIKSADETVTNSAVFQNDDHLTATVLANTQYWVEFFLIYDGYSANDIQIQWSAPAGATFDWTHGGLALGTAATLGTVSRNYRTLADTGTIGCPNAASGSGNVIIPGYGRLVTAGTAGSLTLQWSQVVAGAATTAIIRQRSVLILQRLTV